MQGTKLKLKQYEQPGELVTLDSGVFSRQYLQLPCSVQNSLAHALRHSFHAYSIVTFFVYDCMQLQDPIFAFTSEFLLTP